MRRFLKEDPCFLEMGVDEAGRGPLFGRVYAASVILPKDDESFDHSRMKDSKKFHSKKKIGEVADYIKEHAIAWSVSFADERLVDEINILQATQMAMHDCILETRRRFIEKCAAATATATTATPFAPKLELLIDGNYFNPLPANIIPYTLIEGGDNIFTSIAAASILAKVERDRYIADLCQQHPTLSEHYGIDTNMGYGAKKHIDGIKKYGITVWHRKSFGICKTFA